MHCVIVSMVIDAHLISSALIDLSAYSLLFYSNRLLISHLCFDSELFITFLVGLILRAVERKRIFFIS